MPTQFNESDKEVEIIKETFITEEVSIKARMMNVVYGKFLEGIILVNGLT